MIRDLLKMSQPKEVTGLDWGTTSVKAVVLALRKEGVVMTDFATYDKKDDSEEENLKAAEVIKSQIKNRTKFCAVALPVKEGLLKIIEQPKMERSILRQALNLNGAAMLNQEV